jgi:uncharacterized membrane protein
MFPHAGPPVYPHPWWGFFGVILPILMLAALIGLVVWAVLRLTSQGARPAGQSMVLPAQGRPSDPALEHARYRYAQGEIDRDQFLLISSDLGAPVSPPPPPAPAAAGEPDG